MATESRTTPTPLRRFFHRLTNRMGCLLLFIVWLVVMAMPCAFVTLLVEKELTYSLSDLPEHQLRLFLLDDSDSRGFGFSRASIREGGADEAMYCVATHINYLMWEGEAQSVEYCDCYESDGERWQLASISRDGTCLLPTAEPGE